MALYVRSTGDIDLSTSSDRLLTLASEKIMLEIKKLSHSLIYFSDFLKTGCLCIWLLLAELWLMMFQSGLKRKLFWRQMEQIMVQDFNWQPPKMVQFGLIKSQPCLWILTRFFCFFFEKWPTINNKYGVTKIDHFGFLGWSQGHGFRNDLFQMMVDLKPRFIRFPGNLRRAKYHFTSSYIYLGIIWT